MKFVERVKIVEGLSYELRLAYIAFCVERCFKEAKRHDRANQQLLALPQLQEGLDLVWARAEKTSSPAPSRVQEIKNTLDRFETAAPDQESIVYLSDPVLAHGARMLKKGLQLLINPSETARYVAGAETGPHLAAGLVYTDWEKARAAELAVTEAALVHLGALADKTFTHAIFNDISEWPRGEVAKKYASNNVKGTAVTDDD